MFYPIAIRILRKSCAGAKKLTPGVFYYLVKGIKINESASEIAVTYRVEDNLYSNADDNLHVTFSAVVGENGAGKSTLIELFIRLCNNFAASLFGEYSDIQGKPHLHYIDGIYAELYYRNDDTYSPVYYRLKIEGRNVELLQYTVGNPQNGIVKYIPDVNPIFDNAGSIDPNLRIEQPFERFIAPKGEANVKEILSHFFYSYVSNFCSYAYNHSDFATESTKELYERKCRKCGPIPLSDSQKHWLEGLFHRKESYQVPIVLYPNRKDGNININNENWLAYVRFLSVLISEKSRFRKINDHLEVTGFQLSINSHDVYDDKYIRKEADYRFTQQGYRILRNKIIDEWGKIVGFNLKEKAEERNLGEDALDYLVYKTLKVSSEYSFLRRYFHSKHCKSRSKFDLEALKRFIGLLAKDTSHITRKIRQTLIYILFGLYDFKDANTFMTLDEIRSNCAEIYQLATKAGENKWLITLTVSSIEDLTPPPFMTTTVVLKDTKSEDVINFKTLSSGEKQLIYSITGIIYQIINLDSVSNSGSSDLVCYSSVNVILEEIELYFHPDMQRRLVKFILDAISQCTFHFVKNVNVMLVTHSPFILSDIPASNILALTKDGLPLGDREIVKSFGANIHDILRHPFFLKDGAVGEFASDFISSLGNQISNLSDNNNNANLNHIISEVKLVDEPILRKVLLEEITRRTTSKEAKRELLNAQIEELQRLKREIDD